MNVCGVSGFSMGWLTDWMFGSMVCWPLVKGKWRCMYFVLRLGLLYVCVLWVKNAACFFYINDFLLLSHIFHFCLEGGLCCLCFPITNYKIYLCLSVIHRFGEMFVKNYMKGLKFECFFVKKGERERKSISYILSALSYWVHSFPLFLFCILSLLKRNFRNFKNFYWERS